MCGLAGVIFRNDTERLSDLTTRLMCGQMEKRGPDAEGYWTDSSAGICFGHRRLSIIDVNSRANQPMQSDDDRMAIVFNGEIYNFLELRTLLENKGEIFHTKSDTEVLLKLYAREGEAMLPMLRGMFAFAIWDKQSRSLFLARDPYGIKPLYLAKSKYGWLFASQVKALLASELVDRAPDPIGQAGFWLLGSVPEPHTWFRDIRAVGAGTWCRISSNGDLTGPHSYWDIGETWRGALESMVTPMEAQERVRAAVSESVRMHMVSDVPVGVFLSGGIDSGSLAGLMKEGGAASVQGVTIAFSEFKGQHQDETPAASEIARRYGINHHIRTVTRKEFTDDLPQILMSMDQPSIDGINTWYASKAIAELGLKVVISGVGGDELFYGYSSFRQIPRLVDGWMMFSKLPGSRLFAQLLLKQLSALTSNTRWNWLASQAGGLHGAYWLRRGLFTPEDLPALMGEELADQVLRQLDPASLVGSLVGVLPKDGMAAVGQLESLIYLRNQLLRDSDWASMAHGVELRTPLVDPWLLRELMPIIRSFSRLNGKTMLANSPKQPLPKSIINRQKSGFGIPLGVWTSNEPTIANPHTHKARSQTSADSRRWAKIVSKSVYA